MQAIRWGLMGLAMVLILGGCRRQPLNETAVHEALGEKREQYRTEIERGVQTAPPPIEVPNAEQPATPNQNPSQPGVPPYQAPPPTVSNEPHPQQNPSPPPDTRVGDVQFDPRTGQYGIAPPGAPEGYTIPLNNPPANQSAGESK